MNHLLNLDNKNIWDVVVIGGGPAGMMASGTAAVVCLPAGKQARVILIEKNSTLGTKLLISGGGRCNLTNAEMDTHKLLEKYGVAGKFLFSAFAQWGVKDTLDFFHKHNVPTKIENELRVFPVSDKAQSVLDALTDFMKNGKVKILTNSPVKKFITKDNVISGVQLTNGDIINGKLFILATGGKSRPETGSTGDGFKWLKTLGHTVIDSAPALVPVTLSDLWIKDLQGISLPMVRLSLFQDNARQSVHKGKLLFTHFGISGPVVLNMSNEIREYLEYGAVTLVADLLPTFDHKQIDTAILEAFKRDLNKKFKNIDTKLLPAALVQTLGKLVSIDPETPCHSISREARLKFVQLIKAIPLHVTGTLGLEKAIITSGGIALEEVDFKTMRSRKIPNLYLTGDILNIVRPTGGYSFQLCWTTGAVAGRHASEKN